MDQEQHLRQIAHSANVLAAYQERSSRDKRLRVARRANRIAMRLARLLPSATGFTRRVKKYFAPQAFNPFQPDRQVKAAIDQIRRSPAGASAAPVGGNVPSSPSPIVLANERYKDFQWNVEWVSRPWHDGTQHGSRVAIWNSAGAEGAANQFGSIQDVADLANYDWVVFAEPGDTWHDELAQCLSMPDFDTKEAVVFDHDFLVDGVRSYPQLKPPFQTDLYLENDYIGNAVAFRATFLSRVFGPEADVPTPRQLLLTLLATDAAVGKIDAVLLHKATAALRDRDRLDQSDPATVQSDAREHLNTLNNQLADSRIVADLAMVPTGVHVRYRPLDDPLVSIIVPFKDQHELTAKCVASVLQRTSYQNFELILVNNRSVEEETEQFIKSLTDSRIRILDYDQPFNYSKLNNWAVREAKGSILVFLNNDTEVISPDWLSHMAGAALRPDVGAVGAILRHQDETIQHAGVVVGVRGYAGHIFAGKTPEELPHSYVRHTRRTSAVTAACLAIQADLFTSIGGFDERFIVAGNDVELGLRLTKSGRKNLVLPYVEMYHYEKRTRHSIPPNRIDIDLSLELYEPFLSHGDPYWNSQYSIIDLCLTPKARLEPPATSPELFGDVTSKNPRLAELLRYDASDAQIEASQRAQQGASNTESGSLKSATWLLPLLPAGAPSITKGGLFTIFRIASYLAESQGTTNHFVFCGGVQSTADLESIRQQLNEHFPPLHASQFTSLTRPELVSELPATTIGICTLWTTAYYLLKFNKVRQKFYLVQDYEPLFEPAGSTYGLIEQTYRFGFRGIANSPGVGDGYRSFGNVTHTFVPAVDTSLYYPRDERADTAAPLRVVAYARANPRNALPLIMESLKRIKLKYGDAVEIITVGGEIDLKEFGAEGLIENQGYLTSLEEVADLYRSCDIGLVFMFTWHPSYQPLEYMASGVVTVTNRNEHNFWLMVDGETCVLSGATVSSVVDAVSKLVDDRELLQHIRQGGLAAVSNNSWSKQLGEIADFIAAETSEDA